MLNENLKKQCSEAFKLSNCDINKFSILLQKGVYESMDDWKKPNETSLPKKEDFYSNLKKLFWKIYIWKTLTIQFTTHPKKFYRL